MESSTPLVPYLHQSVVGPMFSIVYKCLLFYSVSVAKTAYLLFNGIM